MDRVPVDKQAFLVLLNDELRRQAGFEEGMAITDLDERGYHLCDPRLLRAQRGERTFDFTFAPYMAAIEAVATGFSVLTGPGT